MIGGILGDGDDLRAIIDGLIDQGRVCVLFVTVLEAGASRRVLTNAHLVHVQGCVGCNPVVLGYQHSCHAVSVITAVHGGLDRAAALVDDGCSGQLRVAEFDRPVDECDDHAFARDAFGAGRIQMIVIDIILMRNRVSRYRRPRGGHQSPHSQGHTRHTNTHHTRHTPTNRPQHAGGNTMRHTHH